MKVPKSVQAPFGPYTIERASNLTNKSGAAAWGICQFDPRRIMIDSSLSGDALRETLIHEWLHACIFDGGFDELMSGEMHEAIVGYLARCISRYLPKV